MAGAAAFSFFQERHLLQDHPPEAGEVGRYTGTADGLAGTQRCRPAKEN